MDHKCVERCLGLGHAQVYEDSITVLGNNTKQAYLTEGLRNVAVGSTLFQPKGSEVCKNGPHALTSVELGLPQFF